METTIFLTVTSTSTRPIPTNINTLYNPAPDAAKVTNNLYTTMLTTVIAVVTKLPASPTKSINFIDDYTASQRTVVTNVVTNIVVPQSSISSSTGIVPSATGSSITPSTKDSLPAATSGPSVNKSLAIGLPVALAVLFIVGLFAAFLIRRKAGKSLFGNKKTTKSEVEKNDDDTLANSLPHEYGKNSVPTFNDGPNKRQSIAYYLKDIFSKNASISDEHDVESNRRFSMLSPMFLKKFNLNQSKSKLGEVEVVDPCDSNGRNKLDLKLPVSVNQDRLHSKIDTNLDPVKGGVSPRHKLYITIQNYTKRLNDELTIVIGDKVVIQQDYLDGWCLIRIIKTGKEYYNNGNTLDTGMVPKVCLREIT